MVVKLKDIASVQMGYSFRSRLETVAGGQAAVIQMKDLQEDNRVNCQNLVRIDMSAVREHHLAQIGDLVFRSRGSLNTTAILNDDPGIAVVAAPLLRLRVTNPATVLPEYLNWYISQRDAQVFLTSRAKGSAQKMISKQAIENLKVPLPSLKKQKDIVELAVLSSREQTLLNSLALKRKQLIESLLLAISKGEPL